MGGGPIFVSVYADDLINVGTSQNIEWVIHELQESLRLHIWVL